MGSTINAIGANLNAIDPNQGNSHIAQDLNQSPIIALYAQNSFPWA